MICSSKRLTSAAPIAAWALHNYEISGTLFGPRELGAMLPLQNLSLSATKMLWWFVPRIGVLDWLLLRPWIVMFAALILLLLINHRRDWLDWIMALSNAYVWPGLVFAVVYSGLLAFTVVTASSATSAVFTSPSCILFVVTELSANIPFNTLLAPMAVTPVLLIVISPLIVTACGSSAVFPTTS